MGGMRLVVLTAVGWAAASVAAQAGEEVKCAEQYTLEEQLILEWAALGGDPHAQFAVAQCAYPDRVGELSDGERLYALKWLTLAACEAQRSERSAQRDRMTRKLKESADLSFRRFGGMDDDEDLNRREKRFVEFRDWRAEKLAARFESLQSRVSDADRAEMRDMLGDQFARQGALGLLRLGELTECPSFGATPAYSAAVWAAAAESWKTMETASAYGKSAESGWSVAAESETRLAALSKKDRRHVDAQKAELLKTDPRTIARLESEAALGRLEQLAFILDGEGETASADRSVTTATQYALEAMGFLQFVSGPDNDYGPSTIEAARRAQAHYGVQPTRWLSHEEVRRVVCDAATLKADPVSYYHLGVMYSQGWGFARDLNRAEFALERARAIMEARLADAHELPEWKQEEYPKFRAQIESASAAVASARAGAPLHANASGHVDETMLCR